MNATHQKSFILGKIPSALPDGHYRGSVGKRNTNWLGKKFNTQENTGINLFEENGKKVEKYPFKTYIGRGAVDHEIKVIKIDYNLPQNPLWLRFILDEIVEIKPNHYLGKLIIRLPLNLNIALGFFELTSL